MPVTAGRGHLRNGQNRIVQKLSGVQQPEFGLLRPDGKAELPLKETAEMARAATAELREVFRRVMDQFGVRQQGNELLKARSPAA